MADIDLNFLPVILEILKGYVSFVCCTVYALNCCFKLTLVLGDNTVNKYM